ncbi:MAG: hypothetical protein ABI623_02925 [bacterium]
MNLESEILKEHSRSNTIRIAKWIGPDKKRFAQLMKLFLKGEYRVTQRSAWVLMYCADWHPVLIRPYLDKMIDRMLEAGVHVAVKRNVVRILQNVDVPERLAGKVATLCFDFLASQEETVAVRVFSMTVLARIATKEPELTNELRLLIEQQMPWGTAGFRARGRRILKQLESLR